MVIHEDLSRWMASRDFRFQKLVIPGIDNDPVLSVNNPQMAEEETCFFHSGTQSGDDYLTRLQQRTEQSLLQHRALPVVRFADGEYAFYQGSLTCNGLYRQAESVHHIKRALPLHLEALRTLFASGIAAPLVFPGNVKRRAAGFLSFIKNRKEKPSASTFLDFLDHHTLSLTGDNYIPFYVIYAWLTSTRFARSVDQRKVCILNADWDAQAVAAWFNRFSSHPELFFVDIPREYVATQWSLQRETVLSKIPPDTDLCLVGAGIGALPVCVDVAMKWSIPAIDAGHALNMMNGRVDKSNGARLYTLWKTP